MRKIFLIVVLLTAVGCLLYPAFCQQLQETDEEAAARRAEWDKGPKTIDVSGYPSQMQEYYKIFVQKCSKCHNLARSINSDYCLPDEWERYVKRMLRKPGSGIYVPDGEKIYDFLVYDSSIRKKDCIDRKTLSKTE